LESFIALSQIKQFPPVQAQPYNRLHAYKIFNTIYYNNGIKGGFKVKCRVQGSGKMMLISSGPNTHARARKRTRAPHKDARGRDWCWT